MNNSPESPNAQELFEKFGDALRILGMAESAAVRWDDASLSVNDLDFFSSVTYGIIDEIRESRGKATQRELMQDELREDVDDVVAVERSACGEKGPGKSCHKAMMPTFATKRQLVASAIEIAEAADLLHKTQCDRLEESQFSVRIWAVIRELEKIVIEISILLVDESPTGFIEVGEREKEVWRDESPVEGQENALPVAP